MPVPSEAGNTANRIGKNALAHPRIESPVSVVAASNGGVSGLPSFLLEPCPATELNVYLHPGRSGLGQMSPDQVRGQFDWTRATFHPSLSAAELAARNYVGFLVEVVGAFEDGEGRSHHGGAFFVPLDLRDTATKG